MTMTSDNVMRPTHGLSTPMVYEVQTRKPVAPTEETFISHRFTRACNLDRIALTGGAVLIEAILGDTDLDADFVPGTPVTSGTVLVLNVRNDAEMAQDIVAAIHVSGEHGPEAEATSITIFNGVGRTAAAHQILNGAVSDEPLASSMRAAPAAAPRGIGVASSPADPKDRPNVDIDPGTQPIPSLMPLNDGETRIVLYAEDAEALLSFLLYHAPITEALRVSLDYQFQMSQELAHVEAAISRNVLSAMNEVILTLEATVAEALIDAIQYRQEYELEERLGDTRILIQALETALQLPTSNEVQTEVADAETNANRKVSEIVEEANEGELLSIAVTEPSVEGSDKMTEIDDVPDPGNETTPGKITPDDGRTEK